LNETKERIVPEDLFRPSLEGAHRYGYCGGGPIELMEIVRLVPERIEGRFSGARPGVHHVVWAVPPASVEDLPRELEDRGPPEYLSAQLGEIDITFHDASASLGHDIEIHVDSQGLRDFFQMRRTALLAVCSDSESRVEKPVLRETRAMQPEPSPSLTT
jgi:hypothetical protein